MPKINTYVDNVSIEDNDKLLTYDVGANATKLTMFSTIKSWILSLLGTSAFRTLRASDEVMTVRDGGLGRSDVTDMAKMIVEDYAGSIVAGSAQSVKDAIDALDTAMGTKASAAAMDALEASVAVLEPAASASDAGKALVAKTVADGKVTEYEFGEAVTIDDTLTQEGQAADAKKTGDEIADLKDGLEDVEQRTGYLENWLTEAEIPMGWGTISMMLHDGRKPFAIGDTFSEPWTDTATETAYDNPWRVNHYETVETEGGILVPGMWLQNQYALPFGIPFSNNRAFLRCPNGLPAGTYHVVFGATWGSKGADKDSAWTFTLTQDVEAGGRLAGFYGLPDANPSTYKVYNYGADGKTIIETVNVASGDSGTILGTMNLNTRNGDMNSMQEAGYGWNNYQYSAMRQFLNSEAGVGEWWTPQDGWDVAPAELATKAGFLSGLSSGFISSLVPVKVVTYQNTMQDGGTASICYDKVTMPSLSQMYFDNGAINEGEAHEYFRQLNGTETKYKTGSSNIYPELIIGDVSTKNAVSVRLRSATRGNAHAVCFVHSSGYVASGAPSALRPAPLVFIG